MNSLSAVLPILQSALGVVAAFKGDAKSATTVQTVQDAVRVVTALSPLVQQFGWGQDVTADQVRQALADKDEALRAFDDELARQELTK